jgi:hypothetical protein
LSCHLEFLLLHRSSAGLSPAKLNRLSSAPPGELLTAITFAITLKKCDTGGSVLLRVTNGWTSLASLALCAWWLGGSTTPVSCMIRYMPCGGLRRSLTACRDGFADQFFDITQQRDLVGIAQ